jgi:hypothetical protein
MKNKILKLLLIFTLFVSSIELKAQYTELNITNNNSTTDVSVYLVESGTGNLVYSIVVPANSSICVSCIPTTLTGVCFGDATSSPCGFTSSQCFPNGTFGPGTSITNCGLSLNLDNNTFTAATGTITCSNPHTYNITFS